MSISKLKNLALRPDSRSDDDLGAFLLERLAQAETRIGVDKPLPGVVKSKGAIYT